MEDPIAYGNMRVNRGKQEKKKKRKINSLSSGTEITEMFFLFIRAET